jgi:hypothetical protein
VSSTARPMHGATQRCVTSHPRVNAAETSFCSPQRRHLRYAVGLISSVSALDQTTGSVSGPQDQTPRLRTQLGFADERATAPPRTLTAPRPNGRRAIRQPAQNVAISARTDTNSTATTHAESDGRRQPGRGERNSRRPISRLIARFPCKYWRCQAEGIWSSSRGSRGPLISGRAYIPRGFESVSSHQKRSAEATSHRHKRLRLTSNVLLTSPSTRSAPTDRSWNCFGRRCRRFSGRPKGRRLPSRGGARRFLEGHGVDSGGDVRDG